MNIVSRLLTLLGLFRRYTPSVPPHAISPARLAQIRATAESATVAYGPAHPLYTHTAQNEG